MNKVCSRPGVATDIHFGSKTLRLTAKKQTRTVGVLFLELTEKETRQSKNKLSGISE